MTFCQYFALKTAHFIIKEVFYCVIFSTHEVLGFISAQGPGRDPFRMSPSVTGLCGGEVAGHYKSAKSRNTKSFKIYQ